LQCEKTRDILGAQHKRTNQQGNKMTTTANCSIRYTRKGETYDEHIDGECPLRTLGNAQDFIALCTIEGVVRAEDGKGDWNFEIVEQA
jgi:hypothetical protein